MSHAFRALADERPLPPAARILIDGTKDYYARGGQIIRTIESIVIDGTLKIAPLQWHGRQIVATTGWIAYYAAEGEQDFKG